MDPDAELPVTVELFAEFLNLLEQPARDLPRLCALLARSRESTS